MGGIVVENCVSRTVRDNAMLFSLTEDTGKYARFKPIGFVAGPAKRRLRIAFGTASCFGAEPHPDVKAAVEASAKLCESLGHTIAPAQNPVNGPAFYEAFQVVWSSLPAKLVQLAKSKNLNPENVFEPFTLELADYAMKLPPDALPKAQAVFKETEAQIDAFMANYDVWLTPVLASPPVRLGELAPTLDLKTLSERRMHYVVYTQIHNVAGTPAMSAPLGMSQDGLPIGSQFAAALGREDCSSHSPMSWNPPNPGRRARRKSGWDDAGGRRHRRRRPALAQRRNAPYIRVEPGCRHGRLSHSGGGGRDRALARLPDRARRGVSVDPGADRRGAAARRDQRHRSADPDHSHPSDHAADARPVPAGHQRPDDRTGVLVPQGFHRDRLLAGLLRRHRGGPDELDDVRVDRRRPTK